MHTVSAEVTREKTEININRKNLKKTNQKEKSKRLKAKENK